MTLVYKIMLENINRKKKKKFSNNNRQIWIVHFFNLKSNIDIVMEKKKKNRDIDRIDFKILDDL